MGNRIHNRLILKCLLLAVLCAEILTICNAKPTATSATFENLPANPAVVMEQEVNQNPEESSLTSLNPENDENSSDELGASQELNRKKRFFTWYYDDHHHHHDHCYGGYWYYRRGYWAHGHWHNGRWIWRNGHCHHYDH